jgi:hypothetical protein
MTDANPEPAVSPPANLPTSTFKFGQVLTLPALAPSLGRWPALPLTRLTKW